MSYIALLLCVAFNTSSTDASVSFDTMCVFVYCVCHMVSGYAALSLSLQFFASTLGSLVGSQVVPVYFPSHHRRRLLAYLVGVLLLFIPAFAAALHSEPGHAAFIPLVFILFTHSGCVDDIQFWELPPGFNP